MRIINMTTNEPISQYYQKKNILNNLKIYSSPLINYAITHIYTLNKQKTIFT